MAPPLLKTATIERLRKLVRRTLTSTGKIERRQVDVATGLRSRAYSNVQQNVPLRVSQPRSLLGYDPNLAGLSEQESRETRARRTISLPYWFTEPPAFGAPGGVVVDVQNGDRITVGNEKYEVLDVTTDATQPILFKASCQKWQRSS